MCLFGSRSKPETKASAFELTAESVSQPACCISYWYVARMHTSSTQGDARKGNLILIFLFATKTKARTVGGKGVECVPCEPGYELRKGESLTKSCAGNTRGWDRNQKTQASCMNVFPALQVRVLIDWVLHHPIIIIHNNINTRYLDVQKKFFLANPPPLTTPVHYEYHNSSTPESLKAALNA